MTMTVIIITDQLLKAKFHYAILVTDRFEAEGRRPVRSWNLAYHLAR